MFVLTRNFFQQTPHRSISYLLHLEKPLMSVQSHIHHGYPRNVVTKRSDEVDEGHFDFENSFVGGDVFAEIGDWVRLVAPEQLPAVKKVLAFQYGVS